jgi:hypothetical protein
VVKTSFLSHQNIFTSKPNMAQDVAPTNERIAAAAGGEEDAFRCMTAKRMHAKNTTKTHSCTEAQIDQW